MIRISLSFFICFMIFNPCFAEIRKVTLIECIDIALQNHPDFLITNETRKKTFAQYRVAKSQRNILINGEIKTIERLKAGATGDTNFQVPGKDTDIGLFAGLSAIYNLYDYKKKIIANTARIVIDLSKFESQKIKDITILNVKKAYYSYLVARENMNLSVILLKKFQKKKKLTQRLYKSGVRPILDVSKADVAVVEAMLEYEKAKNRERLKRIELYFSMGIKGNELIEISPQGFSELPQVKLSLNELYKLADLYSPDIRIVKLKRKILKLKISAERASHIPRVDVILGLGFENSQIFAFENNEKIGQNFKASNWNPAFHIMIRAGMSIYSGGAIVAKTDSAISDYNIMVYRGREKNLEMKNMILSLYKQLDELTNQFKISKLIIENSRKHLLLVQKSYENGIGSQLTLQDAEMSVIRAELGYISTKYKYFLTLANLSNIVGIGEDYLCKK